MANPTLFGAINSDKALGLTDKTNVRIATTAALPSNTAAGSGVGKTLTADAVGVLSVDGVSLVLNDRILVKDESTGANNGIYKMTTEGTAGVAFVLTRATDFDEVAATEVATGASVYIEEGTLNAKQYFALSNTGTITLETTSLTFSQSTGVGLISDDTTTNATMYPLWVTASSGILPLKVSSTKLSFNPSSGTLTSSILNSTTASISTSITSPLLIGGSAVNSAVTIQGTTGNGSLTAQAFVVNVGNNGGTLGMTILNNTKVGINNGSPSNQLDVYNSNASIETIEAVTVVGAISSGWSSVRSDADVTPTSNLANYTAGTWTLRNKGSVNNTNGFNGASAGRINFFNSHTGTITNGSGLITQLSNLSTGTITNLNGLLLTTVINSGGGVVTNTWGVRILDHSVGSTINAAFASELTSGTGKYGLYFSGTAQNYLAGNIGIGTNSIDSRVNIKGSGSTSATTALKVTNSSDTLLVKTTDDGITEFGGNIKLTQTVTTEALTSDTSVTIVINGTTYKLLAKA